MSLVAPKNSQYLDRYFSETEASSLPSGPPEGDYAEFDQGYDSQAYMDEFGGMAEEMAEEIPEEDGFGDESDWDIPEPNAEQERLLKWLEENGEKLESKFEEARAQYEALEGGLEAGEDPEQRIEKLREAEDALREIEDDLRRYAQKESQLLKSEDAEEFGLSAPIAADEIRNSLEETQDRVTKDIQTSAEAVEKKQQKETREKQKAEEGMDLKDRFVDLLGYTNGAKGVMYFTAKVSGGRGKHIYDYHEHVTTQAQSLLSAMGEAALSGDWEAVEAQYDALSAGDVDNTLGLVGMILIKHDPQLLEKIPSKILDGMSDAIRRGNAPDDNRIYRIDQDGKFDAPKDHRRRKDMHHEGFSYMEAAERFRSQAESNRRREEIEVELYGEEDDALEGLEATDPETEMDAGAATE